MKKIKLIESESNNEISVELTRSLVIVGANGAGKTRFGASIEKLNTKSKRISAQRGISVRSSVERKNYEKAESGLTALSKNKGPIYVQNDMQPLLETLFAEEAVVAAAYKMESRSTTEKVPVPDSKIDIVLKVWNSVFPNRQIKLQNDKVVGVESGVEFSGSELSEGERVGLYLISQVMLAPEESVLIIDEPELHLHKALMVRLWNKLEEKRNDCAFVYITHDLDFAASKPVDKTIWIEWFKDNKWKWVELDSEEYLPDSLLLEVLGSKKKILFVEGDKGSLDQQLYQEYYEDFTIIPCGSCEKVIEATKGFNNHSELHSNSAFGLIDRDYRSEEELAILATKSIFVTPTKQIESVFLLPEIIKLVCDRLTLGDRTAEIIAGITSDYTENYETISLLIKKKRLSNFMNVRVGEIRNPSDLENFKANIGDETKAFLESIQLPGREVDYIQILKLYPHKGLLSKAQSKLGLKNDLYRNLVFGLLASDKSSELKAIFSTYMPVIEY